jgi:hypothetical protein
MGTCTAQIPDLVGNWTGFENAYAAENGSYKLQELSNVTYTITEQKGRLFKGDVTYMVNGTEITEGFAGAIGLDNKTFYRAELSKGYSIGTIISDNEIDLIYLEDGESGWVIIGEIHRIK